LRYLFNFSPDFATNIPAPPVLGDADPYWIVQPEFSQLFYVGEPNDPALVGVEVPDAGYYTGYTTTVSLPDNAKNLFGLPYQTGCLIKENFTGTKLPAFATLDPGTAASLSPYEQSNLWFWGGYASQCSPPTLTLSNYFFAALLNPGSNPMNLPGSIPGDYNVIQYPTPLDDSFNVTNQTPSMIIAAVGEPVIIGGWAKYYVQGSANKYAYLGQYFETNCFLLDGSGHATTTNAGVLSPYGEFFPTQAGKAQLITLPDMDPPYAQGTCTVSIVSLTMDANHDGAMDLSYFGPDQTSPGKPYVFWVNNDFDRLAHDTDDDADYEDGVAIGFCPLTPYTRTVDANYRDANQYRVIPTRRDLEDFSRLWITGVTTNLLALLPAGSTVTLSWGSVSEGSPTIDLFKAADADGGMGYLTNSTVAAQQVDRTLNPSLGRLAPGDSLTLNSSLFPGLLYGNHYLWCGVANGTGQLTLAFKDGDGHVLGRSSVWIQLKDIKQMYERWTIGDDASQEPATTAHLALDNLAPGDSAFEYGPATTNTPYILFVHGWNMSIADKNIFAETAFKRLWWQGYQGRFGCFRWPTGSGISSKLDVIIHHKNFDDSEFNAWKSGAGLKNMLARLNLLYPGQVYLMAHSMGNVVAGEALRQAGSSQLVNTYLAMQAAVPAHCYDATTPNRVIGLVQPDRYAYYYTNGALCYFSGIAGAKTFVNMFNANDFALDKWKIDQNFKPDVG
jgi:hypothetical protein